MDKERIKQIIEEADEKGFFRRSDDALSDGYKTNYFVPVDKVDAFVEFVATHPLVATNAAKPFVGKVLGLQRHRAMRVHRMHIRSYVNKVDSNVLFPEACLVLDETDTHLCILGNDNIKYWIKRYYFTGPVAEDGTVPRKKFT